VVAVFAATPNFAGNWELDVSRSKLPETMQIESMTLTVVQTEKELSVQTATKRARGGMGNPMRRGDGNQTVIYSLEGKEINAEIGSGAMAGRETRRASVTSDGKLSLTLMRNFNRETGGAVTLKTNDTWELMDEGKTLKVIRYMETPRGATNAELYFTKKDSGEITVQKTVGTDSAAGSEPMVKKISGGVLNGKASSLPAPEYPAAARAVKASGAVNIQVTINEQGDIVSATAVSGHPLLRQAAEEAARKAKFAPTLLQGIPVSVTGVLVYNFVP
jgi:TonB family protein